MFKFSESRILAPDGCKLAVYTWKQAADSEGPLCIIVHGMAEYGLRQGRLVRDLENTGWSFAAFDMRGHGYSEGKPMRMQSIAEPVRDLHCVLNFVRGKELRRRPVVLLGHSFGGLVSLLFAHWFPQDISGLILSSPVLGIYPLFPFTDRLIELLYQIFPDIVVPKPVRPNKLTSDPEVQKQYISDPKIYKFTGIDFLYHMLLGMRYVERNIRLLPMPMLMILGGRDEVVDNRKNIDFFNRLGNSAKEIQICDGFMHETFNEMGRERSIQHVRQFLGRIRKSFAALAFIFYASVLLSLSGCVYYLPIASPVRSPDFYDYRISKNGITVACEPYTSEAQSRLTFGVDVTRAGVLPLEVIMFNQAKADFDVSKISTRLTDTHGRGVPLLSPETANARVKKLTGKTLGAWGTTGLLMVFFTSPAIFRGDEGSPMHLEPVEAVKKSKTAVLEAGGKPISLLQGENVRWFSYFDLSADGKNSGVELLKQDLFLEVSGLINKKTGQEHKFTVFIPLSEKF
ncbi:MAG: lysophospholipase [Candidatus Omnitrophica bacterium]|nr:lysophospholipase [Candidatus Omnitrophota bacterium]